MQYFRSQAVHDVMVSILFIYCKTHEIGYKQANASTMSTTSIPRCLSQQFLWILNMLFDCQPVVIAHLYSIGIPIEIYGIRWLRVLYIREFEIASLLSLWDAIFADNLPFFHLLYVFVAMLVYVRGRLLSSGVSGCLQLLMNYPRTIRFPELMKLIDMIAHTAATSASVDFLCDRVCVVERNALLAAEKLDVLADTLDCLEEFDYKGRDLFLQRLASELRHISRTLTYANPEHDMNCFDTAKTVSGVCFSQDANASSDRFTPNLEGTNDESSPNLDDYDCCSDSFFHFLKRDREGKYELQDMSGIGGTIRTV
ncbi:unnamed protein product [Soboliphyme baturini]|uniref:Rab-GAP TBC domain-containing protein n=1 Tax=Soboliphyme baturini TaxID=241478 RepID=A0A183IU37_9BILA|nr:unnamed protein product [Soboliphyme baturini]